MAVPTQTLTGPTPGQYDMEEQTVPVKETAGGPGVNQTTVTFTGLLASPNGTTTLWTTVTLGKTLYITDIVITTTSSTTVLVQLADGATTIFQNHIYTAKGLELIGIETQPTVAGGDAFNLVLPSVTGNVAYFIAGFVQ